MIAFLLFAWLGVMAFLIHFITEKHWPLSAWALVMFLAAIDYANGGF